ncbi:DMT family transporter [Rhodospirillum sp. A1_3_36]|uniref:DMT family transporter n=1 Tax=Rhodospirillum sp. A1_3_36 TaxID=3391666 RepID=UPI0039A61144
MVLNTVSQKSLLGIWLMVAGIFVVSLEDAGSKFLVEQDYHPFQLMALSGWMVVAVLLVSAGFQKKNLRRGLAAFKTSHWRWHMLRAALSVLTGLCFLFSLKFFKLVDVTIIFFSAPILMTSLSAIFLKEKVGIYRWTAVGAGFLGVVIALQPDLEIWNWKVLLPLCGSFAYAARAVLIRSMSGVETATQIVFHTRLGVALYSTAPMLFFWKNMPVWDFYLLAVMSGLLLVAHVLITKSNVVASLSVVGPFEYTALIWTGILGYAIWGDIPTTEMSLGALFIIGAGILIMYRETRREFSDDGFPEIKSNP